MHILFVIWGTLTGPVLNEEIECHEEALSSRKSGAAGKPGPDEPKSVEIAAHFCDRGAKHYASTNHA
jgi:hypothetical protein